MSKVLLTLCVVVTLSQISEQDHSHVPRLSVSSRDQKVQINLPYTLQCKAEGSKPITISWTINNTQFDPEIHNRYSIKTSEGRDDSQKFVASTLTITKTERSDSGTFKCTATNSFGNDSVDINLLVQEPPEAPYDLKLTPDTVDTHEFSWKKPFDGNSPIIRYVVEYKLSDLFWKNSSSFRVGETIARLPTVTPANSYYNIRIKAVNLIGDSEPSEILNVFTPRKVPGVPTDVRVERQDEHTLVVFWKPPVKDQWNVTVSGYRVGYTLAESEAPYVFTTVESTGEDHEYHLEIPYLKPHTHYSVVVLAFNELGEGDLSDAIKIYTREGVPERPPENFECFILFFQSINLQWKPLTTGANGVIIGYIVIYGPSKSWLDENTRVKKITNMPNTTLFNLQKYTNYTMQVLAVTSTGAGPPTKPIVCQTKEQVPEAPASVKAAVRSSDSIFVVWKPPLEPNGVIINYTVYHKKGDDDPDSYTVGPDQNLRFLVEHLNSSARNVFWVTAATAFAEGLPSKKITLSPNSTAPAKIITFGSSFTVDHKENVILPCPAVGNLPLTRIWKVKGVELSQNGYIKEQPDGSLFIPHVRREDGGKYSCHVDNEHGQDSITYELVVNGPPRGPRVRIVSKTNDSLTLGLKPHESDVETVGKYVIHYKPTSGSWKSIETLVPKHTDGKYTLEELRCGIRYLVYVEAHNRLGKGDPSEILSTKTLGDKPIVPTAKNFVKVSCYSITLYLNLWSDGGCPISDFAVEHRKKGSNEWIQQPLGVNLDANFVLLDLEPLGLYELQVTAWNEAGFSKFKTVAFTRGDFNESECSLDNVS